MPLTNKKTKKTLPPPADKDNASLEETISPLWIVGLHTFSTGRSCKSAKPFYLTQQEPTEFYSVTVAVTNSAQYALSLILSCAASGSWSV